MADLKLAKDLLEQGYRTVSTGRGEKWGYDYNCPGPTNMSRPLTGDVYLHRDCRVLVDVSFLRPYGNPPERTTLTGDKKKLAAFARNMV